MPSTQHPPGSVRGVEPACEFVPEHTQPTFWGGPVRLKPSVKPHMQRRSGFLLWLFWRSLSWTQVHESSLMFLRPLLGFTWKEKTEDKRAFCLGHYLFILFSPVAYLLLTQTQSCRATRTPPLPQATLWLSSLQVHWSDDISAVSKRLATAPKPTNLILPCTEVRAFSLLWTEGEGMFPLLVMCGRVTQLLLAGGNNPNQPGQQ